MDGAVPIARQPAPRGENAERLKDYARLYEKLRQHLSFTGLTAPGGKTAAGEGFGDSPD